MVLTLAGIMAVGALKLRRFESYGLVIAAIILAMLPWSYHCLIGIPAGIWAWKTLNRPEVQAAFAANLRRKQTQLQSPGVPPKETAPALRKARSFWRAFRSAFVSSPRGDEPVAPPSQSAPK